MSGYFEGFDVNKDEKVTLEEVRRFLLEIVGCIICYWTRQFLVSCVVKKGSRRWCQNKWHVMLFITVLKSISPFWITFEVSIISLTSKLLNEPLIHPMGISYNIFKIHFSLLNHFWSFYHLANFQAAEWAIDSANGSHLFPLLEPWYPFYLHSDIYLPRSNLMLQMLN